MSNKTADIEEFVKVTLWSGPVKQEKLLDGFREITTESPQWLGVAVNKMVKDGRIGFTGCDPDHSHEGDCVLTWTGDE